MGEVDYLEAGEVAALFRTTVGTVYRWRHEGRLPGIKPGGRWLFAAGDVAALRVPRRATAVVVVPARRVRTRPENEAILAGTPMGG